ncbi:BAG domain containing protein [Perkinsela sp. CCAP 1560/4]|nr:BAG domain containing protein [Perkinsela sp. CCAP 1560/4]KNH04202.1 BAG domain containing protein [Perkinsela sp. CCAP 1560/4]|eukprot:KNH03962.1 BAG domain containing protein [Perkinsela sp. CCAP 1560/4]
MSSTGRHWTDDDERKKEKIIDAYRAYWEHIRFRKGWAKPAFLYEDVRIPMDIAAEYVVQIRKILDKRSPGMKMRMIDGNAQQYLQGITEKDTRVETFIRDIVHSSLKDATGYVERLDKKLVDNFLAQIEISELSPAQNKLLRSKMQLCISEPFPIDSAERAK